MKLTKAQILDTLQKHKPALAERYHLEKLGLFGSYARDEAGEGSDIDILVNFSQPIGMEIVDLAMELEHLLHHKVDVVTLNAIKGRLLDYIKEDVIYV